MVLKTKVNHVLINGQLLPNNPHFWVILPREDFHFPENACYCYRIGLHPTDFAHTGIKTSQKITIFILF